jgi:peptidyl-prolyl cis-trans isomerase C
MLKMNHLDSFVLPITLLILIQPVWSIHDEEGIDIERPFLTRDIVLFGYRLPITPITLIILFVSIQILYSTFSKPTTAIASHILIDDHSQETEDKMKRWKEELGNDAKKFAQLAKEVSVCPSGKSNGGHLGKFKLGDMVPPFDKAVFSPKNDVGQVIGTCMFNIYNIYHVYIYIYIMYINVMHHFLTQIYTLSLYIYNTFE